RTRTLQVLEMTRLLKVSGTFNARASRPRLMDPGRPAGDPAFRRCQTPSIDTFDRPFSELEGQACGRPEAGEGPFTEHERVLPLEEIHAGPRAGALRTECQAPVHQHSHCLGWTCALLSAPDTEQTRHRADGLSSKEGVPAARLAGRWVSVRIWRNALD